MVIMEEEKLDLISKLPNEILYHILSFLPLKLAVRTSVLSTLWKSLWRISHVKLESGLVHKTEEEEVIQFFSEFLGSYQVLNLWSLSKPILLATMGAHEELHFEFLDRQQVIKNDSSLKFDLISSNNFIFSPATTSIFTSLKTLHLKSVNHLSEIIIPVFFSNCKLLESLELVKCGGLSSLTINGDKRIKSLTVLDCPNMVKISLYAPNLRSFGYRGVLPQFQLKNISNLVDVMVDLRDGPGFSEFDCQDLLSLLAAISHVEILTLSGWFLEWLCSAGVIFGFLNFQFNNLKELLWIGNLINQRMLCSMVCFLNICPFRQKLFIDIDPRRKNFECPLFNQYWHEPHLWMDYPSVKTNVSPLYHLKVVKFNGFSNQEYEFLLIEILLHKAIFMKSMIVKSPENNSRRVVKIPSSQLKQRLRGNRRERTASQGNKSCIEYLEEENRYNIDLSPVHGHLCL